MPVESQRCQFLRRPECPVSVCGAFSLGDWVEFKVDFRVDFKVGSELILEGRFKVRSGFQVDSVDSRGQGAFQEFQKSFRRV